MPFGVIGRTGPGMRQIVRFGDQSMGRGTFGGKFGDFTAYVCDSAATRPSSQLTLGRLVYFEKRRVLRQDWKNQETPLTGWR